MVLLVMFISPAYLVLLSNFVLRAQFNSQKTRSQPIGPPLELYELCSRTAQVGVKESVSVVRRRKKSV